MKGGGNIGEHWGTLGKGEKRREEKERGKENIYVPIHKGEFRIKKHSTHYYTRSIVVLTKKN